MAAMAQEDAVLELLETKQLERWHVDKVCCSLDEVQAKDVRLTFEILSKLQRYLKETESWSFTLLKSHDFEAPTSAFEADLAHTVLTRSQTLLSRMQKWPIPALKEKVSRLPSYSDWAMVLTSLVLRIVAIFTTVQHNLRLAHARATLVEIHCELSSLVESGALSQGETLVDKYTGFVLMLVDELEAARSQLEQKKLFRAVIDLRHMFRDFCRSHVAGYSLEGDKEADKPSERHASHPHPGLELTSALSKQVTGAFEKERLQTTVASILNREAPSALPEGQHRAVEVHKVNGRAMVKHEGRLVDMQEWLGMVNGEKLKMDTPKMEIPRMGLASPGLASPNIATSSFLKAMTTGKW